MEKELFKGKIRKVGWDLFVECDMNDWTLF